MPKNINNLSDCTPKIYILDYIIEKHYCNNASELVLNNRHPSIKVIAAKPPFLNIYKEWEDNIIVQVYGKRHLSFVCPLCGLHS